MCEYETFEANRKFNVATADHVLDFEVQKFSLQNVIR